MTLNLPRRRPLADRLSLAGIDTADDPLLVWRRLYEAEGRRATVIDLYELVAARRGVGLHDLTKRERLKLAHSVMPVMYPGWTVTKDSERANEPIELVEYDPGWPARFARWRTLLMQSLAGAASSVEHVGSTSVPELIAKPVIDIQISVGDVEQEHVYVNQIEATGLQLRARNDGHRLFRPFPGLPRDVHIHVCCSGSNWERDHLLFRDYLRVHPAAAQEYADVKREARREWHDDRYAYTDAKSDFILDTLEVARRWAVESH